METKRCTRCKEDLVLAAFANYAAAADGLQPMCRICKKADNRDRYHVRKAQRQQARVRLEQEQRAQLLALMDPVDPESIGPPVEPLGRAGSDPVTGPDPT